jgi:hypothetical protein
MSHNPTLPISETCNHSGVLEYWHENNECDLKECAVNECVNCGVFATECKEGN